MQEIMNYKIQNLVNCKRFTIEEKRKLLCYFFKVLNACEWVETDESKLAFLLNPFLCSKYVHEGNKMAISKKVILLFYTLRKKLTVSDLDILESILYCFEKDMGLFFESLNQEVVQYWIEKGVDLDETCAI